MDYGALNTFGGTDVKGNAYGTYLTHSTNNTFNLVTNSNGIYLDNASTDNHIVNTQVL